MQYYENLRDLSGGYYELDEARLRDFITIQRSLPRREGLAWSGGAEVVPPIDGRISAREVDSTLFAFDQAYFGGYRHLDAFEQAVLLDTVTSGSRSLLDRASDLDRDLRRSAIVMRRYGEAAAEHAEAVEDLRRWAARDFRENPTLLDRIRGLVSRTVFPHPSPAFAESVKDRVSLSVPGSFPRVENILAAGRGEDGESPVVRSLRKKTGVPVPSGDRDVRRLEREGEEKVVGDLLSRRRYVPLPIDTFDVVLGPKAAALARELAEDIHNDWYRARAAEARGEASGRGAEPETVLAEYRARYPDFMPWAELPVHQKDAAVSQAEQSVKAWVKTIGGTLKAEGVLAGTIRPEGRLEMVRTLTQNAHEVWAKDKMEAGWTYGEKRDNAARKHPMLVPFGLVPEKEKEYDRKVAERLMDKVDEARLKHRERRSASRFMEMSGTLREAFVSIPVKTRDMDRTVHLEMAVRMTAMAYWLKENRPERLGDFFADAGVRLRSDVSVGGAFLSAAESLSGPDNVSAMSDFIGKWREPYEEVAATLPFFDREADRTYRFNAGRFAALGDGPELMEGFSFGNAPREERSVSPYSHVTLYPDDILNSEIGGIRSAGFAAGKDYSIRSAEGGEPYVQVNGSVLQVPTEGLHLVKDNRTGKVSAMPDSVFRTVWSVSGDGTVSRRQEKMPSVKKTAALKAGRDRKNKI